MYYTISYMYYAISERRIDRVQYNIEDRLPDIHSSYRARTRGSARSAAAGRAHTLAEHLRTQVDLCASRGLELVRAILMSRSILEEVGGASWRSQLLRSAFRHTHTAAHAYTYAKVEV
jgi:hypothetical protein